MRRGNCPGQTPAGVSLLAAALPHITKILNDFTGWGGRIPSMPLKTIVNPANSAKVGHLPGQTLPFSTHCETMAGEAFGQSEGH